MFDCTDSLTIIKFAYLNQKYCLFYIFRYYVHIDIVNKFLELLSKYARNLIIGNSLEAGTKMGPVCSRQHYEKVMSYIHLAVKKGHRIVCGETIE